MDDLIKIEDIQKKYKHLLTPESLQQLGDGGRLRKVETDSVKCLFLAKTVEADKEAEAAETISQEINYLASKGMIRSWLCPLSKLQLRPISLGIEYPPELGKTLHDLYFSLTGKPPPPPQPMISVFAFVHVPKEHHDELFKTLEAAIVA